ncbi:hypothetical protein [Aeromonas veronii]|uniref:hypothetical protein n=1 Tax=Aeromonas veronii TaxID=654 RepID=UPI0012D3F86C|nr:hypothetical protein [Aeromonas veronii]
MQIQVIEKTFRLAGESEQVAQFTLTTSGILHIWFPEIGLQMEAHRNQLRIQNNTIIYTDRLDYGEQRAHWALTLKRICQNITGQCIARPNVKIDKPSWSLSS